MLIDRADDGLVAERPGEPERVAAGAAPQASARPWLFPLLALIAIAWLASDTLLLTPAFGGLDIYYFKDPGANMAQGLGFVSRFTYGNPSLDYHTYAQYPPLYPFLYGVFASVFGVSLLSNQIFNSTINLGCGIVAFCAMWPLLRDLCGEGAWRRLAPWLQGGIFVAAIATGFFKPEPDRPDALAVMIGGIAFVLIRNRLTGGRFFIACALCALTFFISPFVSIWATMALLLSAAAAAHAQRLDLAGWARLTVCGAAGGVLTGAVALGLIALLIPDWFGGFSGVLTGATTHNETGGGYFMLLLHGDVRGWAGAFRDFTKHGAGTLYINLGKLMLVQGTLAVAAIWEWARSRRQGQRFQGLGIVALLLASPLSLIITPYQFIYLRITAALLLMAAACVAATMRRGAMAPYALAIVVAYAGISAVSLPRTFFELSTRAVDGSSLGRAEAYIRSHTFPSGEHGRYVAVASETFMLWRQEGVRPLAIVFSGFESPEARSHLDAVALSYARSVDPMAPVFPEWKMGDALTPRYAPRLPQTYTIAGTPIASGSITWESAIFAQHRN